jgi:membrane-bound metal-dependent hydrolase YbcI (DUF457 family)
MFIAVQFADLLWPTLVLLGVEHVEVRPGITAVMPLDFVSYPYSHSLLALCAWGLLFGGVYKVVTGSRVAAGVTLALLVVSHWLLDYVTHRPDLPLTLGGTARVGLGLWSSVPGTLAAELALYGAGIVLYVRSTQARDRVGSIGFWLLAAFLPVAYLVSTFGAPPPSASAVAWAAESMWLVVVWAYWVDGHRVSARSATAREG